MNDFLKDKYCIEMIIIYNVDIILRCEHVYDIIIMSDLVYKGNQEVFQTPEKVSNKNYTLKQIYLTSFKKDCNKQKKCLLCLECSNDCSCCRCSNPQHIVCQECAYEWEIDKVCPVCKNDSSKTIIKPRNKYPSSEQSKSSSNTKWKADLSEIESSQDLEQIDG